MQRKTKVKLENLKSKFFIFTCCSEKQFIANEELEDNTVITCALCFVPKIMKDARNEWYYVFDKVF